MHQVVIYLKPTGSDLVYQQSFPIPGTRHEFQVIRLWEQPQELFYQLAALLPAGSFELTLLSQKRVEFHSSLTDSSRKGGAT